MRLAGGTSPQQNDTKTRVIKTCIGRKKYNKNCRVRNGNERTGWATSSKFPLCVSSVSPAVNEVTLGANFILPLKFLRGVKATSPQSCVWDDNFQSKRYLYKLDGLYCGKCKSWILKMLVVRTEKSLKKFD